jgi:phage portal protein BeeE
VKELIVNGVSSGTGFVEPPFWAYPTYDGYGSTAGDRERVESDFLGYVEGAFKANGVVFTCILIRSLIFSEARFQWQRMSGGRPGEHWGDRGLELLERPWPNGTTGELLSHIEQDASLAGNAFLTVVGSGPTRRLRRLRPDWVTVVTGSPSDDPFDIDARITGYLYHPRGLLTEKATLLTPEKVAHFAPIPDPAAQWRGMSWLTPVVREIDMDAAATNHKRAFFENGAAMSLALKYDPSISEETFLAFVAAFKAEHEGTRNAYKTLHLGGGADPTVIGTDLRQLDFKVTQGAGETRIAAASGLGAVMAQFSEGLAGSSLNAGNFSAARRRSADVVFRPLWRMVAASLETLVPPPSGSRLWYDPRHIAFLKEDAKDAAVILQTRVTTITTLIREGFTPESAIKAVDADDLTLLRHSGLVSVQLQSPGALDVASNGDSALPVVMVD